MTAALFDVITVHCFFNAGHTVQGVTPQEAHDLMEDHYAAVHAGQIARLIGATT
jgi:hypothetical protein